MTAPPAIAAGNLNHDGVAHGFFSREGGVSEGVFASLNTGLGSDDEPERVAENRRRCAARLGVAPERLLTNYQVHSAEVIVVEGPWADTPPEADGLVTKARGVAIGALAADCMPWLFVDPDARVIGAAHAGWRGALAGVLENTVAKMASIGAKPERIRAAVGPCLRPPNFQVGEDLAQAFCAQFEDATQFFTPDPDPGKRQFDLVGFGAWRLRAVGLDAIEDTQLCTLSAPDRFFSYRASRKRGDPDYGRNLSAISLL